jgi:succinylarginine dihydrolase
MRNGGGPACLRLRVILTDAEQQALQGRALLTDDRYRTLVAHIQQTYPDRLTLEDLRDWQLCEQLQEAVEQVAVLLGLPRFDPTR